MTPRDRAQVFCDRFGLRMPILQAPMASASPPALAAAVANAGGLGGLGALMSAPAAIAEWAKTFRGSSNGAFQVNLWVPDPPPVRDAAQEAAVRERLGSLAGREVPDAGPGPFTQDFAAQFQALLDAGPAIASTIMGLFETAMVQALKARNIAWFATVTTLADARAAEAAGADAIIAQGAEAGGHRGAFDQADAERQLTGLFALVPIIADAVRVPVIATGGIMDGRGIAAALTLGASAVQLGTAYLRTPEAGLHKAYADAIPHGETVLTRAFSGRLGRGLKNQVTDAFMDLAPAPYPVQRALMVPVRAAGEAASDISRMQAWAGQGAAMAVAEPAAALTVRLWADASALLV